jgi:hypothetical protein
VGFASRIDCVGKWALDESGKYPVNEPDEGTCAWKRVTCCFVIPGLLLRTIPE